MHVRHLAQAQAKGVRRTVGPPTSTGLLTARWSVAAFIAADLGDVHADVVGEGSAPRSSGTREHGCRQIDEGAKHTKWVAAQGPGRSAVPHPEIKTGTVRATRNQLGIPPRVDTERTLLCFKQPFGGFQTTRRFA